MQRRQDDIEIAVAQQFGRRIGLPVESNFFDEPVYDLKPDLLVGLLAAFKPEFDAHFMIIAKELDGVVALHRQVVRINGRRELQLLHSGGRLRAAGIFGALCFLVEELAVVHYAADRRRGGCGDLDQVEALALGQPQGDIERHNAKLLPGFVQNPDFPSSDLAVTAMQWFARIE